MRLEHRARVAHVRDFNPRIPYGMRHLANGVVVNNFIFQSTHPVWDATSPIVIAGRPTRFQSTHPVWDATVRWTTSSNRWTYFNPRIPYGMRLALCGDLTDRLLISIHASRMGCDSVRSPSWRVLAFQSTHPVWDATHLRQLGLAIPPISIHASRMGCDSTRTIRCVPWLNFNPRIPYGMRPVQRRGLPPRSRNFNPRIPYGMRQHFEIGVLAASYFNPRIPYGMRLAIHDS